MKCSICGNEIVGSAEFLDRNKGYVFCSRQCLFIYQRNGIVNINNMSETFLNN